MYIPQPLDPNRDIMSLNGSDVYAYRCSGFEEMASAACEC